MSEPYLPQCRDWNGRDVFDWAHCKFDGMCLRLERDHVGDVRCITRTPTDITQEIKECEVMWYRQLQRRLPEGMILLGELWAPGHKASEVKSWLANRDNRLRLAIFAIPTLPADSTLLHIHDACTLIQQSFAPYVRMTDADQVRQLMADMPSDIEGYVLKNGQLEPWAKVKPERTIDVIIRSFKPSLKGKFAGLMGSIECVTTEGYPVANVSGMDDQIRIEISDNEDAYIGRVIEVEYQYVGSKGRLRHPRFKRFRDDKNTQECKASQDIELETYWSNR